MHERVAVSYYAILCYCHVILCYYCAVIILSLGSIVLLLYDTIHHWAMLCDAVIATAECWLLCSATKGLIKGVGLVLVTHLSVGGTQVDSIDSNGVDHGSQLMP